MKDWTRKEIQAASKAMQKMGELSFEEFCWELKAIDDGVATVDITDTAERAVDADAAESSKNKSETGAF